MKSLGAVQVWVWHGPQDNLILIGCQTNLSLHFEVIINSITGASIVGRVLGELVLVSLFYEQLLDCQWDSRQMNSGCSRKRLGGLLGFHLSLRNQQVQKLPSLFKKQNKTKLSKTTSVFAERVNFSG